MQNIEENYSVARKMGSQGVVVLSLLAIILSLVNAQRKFVPSAGTCALFPNEEFLIDLRKCQNTCEFYGRDWDCPNYYKPKGDCYCMDGFARLEEDGECVSVTENAECVAKLPIQRESCTGPNEIYLEFVETKECDVSCLTFGCFRQYNSADREKWSPNCRCRDSRYRRLSNGTCVLSSDPECVAEFQPSPERCAALGQVYQVNAPCQEACYDTQYCPSPSGACVCPSGRIPDIRQVSYDYTVDPIEVIACYRTGFCQERATA